MPTSQPKTGLKKRQQISSSNRKMFLWVAGASVIISFAIVALIFIVQKGFMNQKVINEKIKTAETMENNIKSASKLGSSVRGLIGNKALGEVESKVKGNNNLDKIFDALPYEQDTVPFAASLQNTLLQGVILESLAPDDSASSGTTATSAVEPVGDSQAIPFSFKVTGSPDNLINTFKQLNSSIRPISVSSLTLEPAGQGRLTASVSAVTYYQPVKVFKLGEKTVQ